jgi:4-coumarate--CoA ligase (photoactive yellow protein activation family)
MSMAVGSYFSVHESGLEDNFIRYPDFISWIDIVYDSLQNHSCGITFRTSGTTGEPKEVYHTFEVLEREAIFLASLLNCGGDIHSFVRPHHIYGFLYTIALPKYLDKKIIHHEPLPTHNFFSIPSHSLLIATPTLYHQIVKLEKNFFSNIVAVSSTEPLSTELSLKLKERGIEKTIEIYGSSQSLGIGYREDEEEFFTLFEYHQKDALENLQDNLLWSDERHFRVAERLDAQVKYRGYLVDLQRLQKSIAALDGVEECDVVLSKGEIVAFITPADKSLAMKKIAELDPLKPDSIIWMER